MLASQLRGETREKRTKDIHQAASLFAVLAEDAPETLATAFVDLPRGAKTKTRTAANQVLAILQSSPHDRATALLRQFL